ncbi:rhamnogalacturonan lyase, partial [Paenibacillus sp. 28ISP30-2]|nr:rhamnogalacturonan lyase [Paenibacillus sp. 28ISP30-2]
MAQRKGAWRKGTLTAALATMLAMTGTTVGMAAEAPSEPELQAASAVAVEQNRSGSIQLEKLDRGLVAAVTQGGVFLSWRLLAQEVNGYSPTGLTGANFNVYRDGKKISTVTDSTNYVDKEGSGKAVYRVASVVNGREKDRSAKVTPWQQGYYELPLQKPADGVTPAGESYTYSANDMSVGDVDGDGQYEFFVKWDPSNSKDVSQKGYTGNTYVDAYTVEGRL